MLMKFDADKADSNQDGNPFNDKGDFYLLTDGQGNVHKKQFMDQKGSLDWIKFDDAKQLLNNQKLAESNLLHAIKDISRTNEKTPELRPTPEQSALLAQMQHSLLEIGGGIAVTSIKKIDTLPGWANLNKAQQQQIESLVHKMNTDKLPGLSLQDYQLNSSAYAMEPQVRLFFDQAFANADVKVLMGQEEDPTKPFKKPTFITWAFDGSRSLPMWVDTMKVADKIFEKYGKSLHFTYFINSCYYDPNVRGSEIGVAKNHEEAQVRWAITQEAVNKGHEIANHTVRHHNGGKWTYEQWDKEITEFETLVQVHLFEPIYDDKGKPVFPQWDVVDLVDGQIPDGALKNAAGKIVKPHFPIYYNRLVLFDEKGSPNLSHPDLKPYKVKGFRAPQLGVNEALFKVLQKHNYYLFDTSLITGFSAPGLLKYNGTTYPVMEFPLTKLKGKTVPMDFNYLANKISGEQMLADYKKSIEAAASQGKPWNIGHHFSLWRVGSMSYWEAMQKAIEYAAQGIPDDKGVAKYPNIEFLNFRELRQKCDDDATEYERKKDVLIEKKKKYKTIEYNPQKQPTFNSDPSEMHEGEN